MLSTRLISVCILAPIILMALLSFTITQLSILVFIICLISAWEWGRMMRFSTYMHLFWMCIIFGLLAIAIDIIVFQYYLCFNYWSICKYIYGIIFFWWIVAFILILFYPFSSVIWRNSIVLRFCFGVLMIVPFFWGVLTLCQCCYLFTNHNDIITYWALYVITLIWINDSGAYIIGRYLGQYKLLEKVSPQKTWEGFIGGALLSIISAWLFILCYSTVIIKPYIILIYSIITIFSAVIGDLTESMFKREANIKDTGKLIPGHGGILDRMDSLMAAVPIFACLLSFTYLNNLV